MGDTFDRDNKRNGMLLTQIKLPNAGQALDLSVTQERSYILTQKKQSGVLFCVTDKPLWHIKLPFRPSSIKSTDSGVFICGFHHIKTTKGRNLIRPNLAFLKNNAKLKWHQTLFTEDKFNGHCLIWDIMILPNEECILMLLIEMDNTYTIKHVRMSSTGEMLWHHPDTQSRALSASPPH